MDPVAKSQSVIIVGAGAAGISAADHLLKNGFRNVVILEASDRIGGRIHTVQFGKTDDAIVEMGANWIHGATNDNSVFKLADELGLLRPYAIYNRMSSRFMKANGQEIPRQHVRKGLQIYDEYEKILEGKQGNIFPNMTSFFLKELSKLPKPDRPDVSCVLNAMVNYMTFHNGDELDRITAFTGYKELPGGNLRIPNGYVGIFERLVEKFPDGVIRFKTEVSNIHWNYRTGSTVIVTCKNGDVYRADHVIVTCSVGYLKRNHEQLFAPPLPEAKQTVLGKYGFGRVNKIFLQYDTPFWKPGFVGIVCCRENYECKEWYNRLFGFDEVLGNRHVLVAWVAGDGAEMMEALSDDEISTTCTNLLRQFLNNPKIPTPTKVLVTRWCSNPLFYGAYSYSAVDTRQDQIAILREPLHGRRGKLTLMFAGEATQEQYYSTTHGARSSGIREADRLLQLYKIQSSSKL